MKTIVSWASLSTTIVWPGSRLLADQSPKAPDTVGVLVWLLFLILMPVLIIALFLTFVTLLPALSQKTVSKLKESPVKSLVLGLVNYVFLGGIALLSANLGPPGLISVVIFLGLLTLTALGLAAVARVVGRRVFELLGKAGSPFAHLVLGTVVIELTAITPFIGWFVLTPLLSMASLGAAMLALFSRHPRVPGPAIVPDGERGGS